MVILIIINLLIGVHELVARDVVAMRGNDALLLGQVLVAGDLIESDLVVETATRDETARRRVGARHHPSGRHRHHVLFVGRERVPDHQLAVL